MSKTTLIWLVPILTTFHNLEELVFMPMLVAKRNAAIPTFLQGLLPPITYPQFFLAVFTMTAIPYFVAWLAQREQNNPGVGMFLLLSLQFMMLVNVLAHSVLAMLMRGYSHGLVTAIVINLPFSIYLLRRALKEKWIGLRAMSLIVPTALLFHAIGVPIIISICGRVMNLIVIVFAATFLFSSITFAQLPAKAQRRQNTYCNPIDLPYRFQTEGPSRREAADPTLITFHGEYWLFPSKSGGYWHSRDLLRWSFVQPKGYPVDNYAPTVMALNDKVYLAVNDSEKLYVCDDLARGEWIEAADMGRRYGDPALFVDDDGSVYMYHGLSGTGLLQVTKLDSKTFKELHTETLAVSRSPATRGWEVPGDFNHLIDKSPWIEGTWMTRHNGRYYLQYAAPGTEFKTYADGVLVSDKPMGPFSYAPYSPFSYKPTGFITGAGHSSTFEGLDGRYWHIATMTISVRHMFERRLGLFPSRFTKDGRFITDTYLGDYPHYINGDRGLTGWMLLSRKKKVTSSSTAEGHEQEKAVDEDVRTWWSAKTGDAGEWFEIDLGGNKSIEAVQINFADEASTALGRSQDVYKYVLELSSGRKIWTKAIDHKTAGTDSPHDYEVLPKPVRARYIRLRNIHSPNGAKFSLYDLRVFGIGNGARPPIVRGVKANRDSSDPRHVTVSWRPAQRAEFYVVRIGASPDELNQNYQVYDQATSVEIRSLNAGTGYYVTVDAINEAGIAKATSVFKVP